MIKEFITSTIKDAIVSYISTALLVITLVGVSIFGINYYWDSKKEEAVQAVKTKSANAYHVVVDHNITKKANAVAHDAFDRLTALVAAKKEAE